MTNPYANQSAILDAFKEGDLEKVARLLNENPPLAMGQIKTVEYQNSIDAIQDMVDGYSGTNSLDDFVSVWYSHNPVHDRDLPEVAYEVITDDCLTWDEAHNVACRAWTAPEYPEGNLDARRWKNLFRQVAGNEGSVVTDEGVVERGGLEVPKSLWRGAHPTRKNGMAWTSDRSRALWFVNRFGNPDGFHLYRLDDVPVEAVLAQFDTRGEAEWVLDTEGLEPIDEGQEGME